MEKQWILNKNNKLQQLKDHYDEMQSNIGYAHQTAKENLNDLNEMALSNQKLLNKQNKIRQQRANNAISKLQQRLINEQNQKKYAKWRNNEQNGRNSSKKITKTIGTSIFHVLYHSFSIFPCFSIS